MSGRARVAVLISGRGSNMRALVEAARDADYPAEIALVLSNRADAAGLDFARTAGIETLVIEHSDYASRGEFDAAMDAELRARDIGIVCLAGFMRLLGDAFVEGWRDRILNIHPSLLPAFKGLDVHERMLEAGVKFGGCTVHVVRPEMDSGPIVIQAVVPVLAGDTAEALADRILEQEHRCYPLALAWLAAGRVRIDGERTVIAGAPAPAGALRNPDEG
jgi:phosphoribosylglycinamide formyltransferase-1